MEKFKVVLTVDSKLGKAGDVVELSQAEADQARHSGIARRASAQEANDSAARKSDRSQEK